jgi:histone demethylase JARID1
LNDDGGGDGDDDERGKRSESPSKGDATEGAQTELDPNPNSNAAAPNASHKPGPGRPCKQHPKPPPTEAETKKADAILAQYGFTSGERHTVKTLERYSDYFKRKYFSGAGGVPIETSIRDLEGEFWRLVESPAGRSVEVIYGADIATMEVGSGLTNKVSLFLTFRVGNWTDGANLCLQDDPCLDAPDQKRYATSPWNVCNMPYNPSSCLKHVEATTGITVPWLYFGMTLSTFCWHVEDHHFYSVNYHHFGTFLFLFIFTWVGD